MRDEIKQAVETIRPYLEGNSAHRALAIFVSKIEDDAKTIKDYKTQQIFDKKCLDDSFDELKRQDATIKELRECINRLFELFIKRSIWCPEIDDILVKVKE